MRAPARRAQQPAGERPKRGAGAGSMEPGAAAPRRRPAGRNTRAGDRPAASGPEARMPRREPAPREVLRLESARTPREREVPRREPGARRNTISQALSLLEHVVCVAADARADDAPQAAHRGAVDLAMAVVD